MADFEPRPIHLHSLDSLLADLVSGRKVIVDSESGRTSYALPDDRSRSALRWYQRRGASNWSRAVTVAQGEEIVDAILAQPPILPALSARPLNAQNRRITLKKLEAHRFAGLHRFGTPTNPPPNFVQEFTSPITLFEGANGSGKTSIANAIIWALTGELLRAQREPERANEEFECWVEAQDGAEQTSHRLTPVTPLPDTQEFRPSQAWVPADTWVELTFEDERGTVLPPIRRTQTRTAQGKIIEIAPNLEPLGVDPIAVRIGTIMPGILSLIRVGSESELGKAVSQLTGLSSLIDLADHVRRAKQKIDKEFIRHKLDEIKSADQSYERAKADLLKEINSNPNIAPPLEVPSPSQDGTIDGTTDAIVFHFENAKSVALSSAKQILGDSFDPSESALRSDLERNILPALNEIAQIGRLASMSRLGNLRKLDAEQIKEAEVWIEEILQEADTLRLLAENPERASRARLYAHVVMWMMDHPDPKRNDNECIVCGGSIDDAVDAVTGQPIKQHIDHARSDAALVSQTLSRWSEAASNDLIRRLPPALQSEIGLDLPSHPSDLIRTAIVDELFATAPFKGVLGSLRDGTASKFDDAVRDSPVLENPRKIDLPPESVSLATTLKRLDTALRFAKWRQANDVLARKLFDQVVGRTSNDGQPESDSLLAKLISLETVVKDAEPITRALTASNRLKTDLAKRRAAEKRIDEYKTASTALGNLSRLGELADLQVEQLRLRLRTEAAKWRDRIYLGAFPGTAHELRDARMTRRGGLELVIGAGEISAPAQHVTNASALRASLIGFFLAFWEHVLRDRGGIRLLLLDDPQELLDQDNRERLAEAFTDIMKIGAQVVVTTYDARFAGHMTRLPIVSQIEHHSVRPATKQHPLVRVPLSEAEILRRKKIFDADKDAEEHARSYVEACRVYLEATLSDLFDDPAYSGWVRTNPDPTFANYVNRLRGLVGASPQGMFGAHVFRDFVDRPSVADQSTTVKLLNKAHHENRRFITPAEVAQCSEELGELVKLADKLHEECRRWRRRDSSGPPAPALPVQAALSATAVPNLKIQICPDLAAFTHHAPTGGSQEVAEILDPTAFDSKALYYLRRDNFGFAAPQGTIAIVQAEPFVVADRRLVVARHGNNTYARRLLRSEDPAIIGLTAETPDPRRSPRTIFLPASEVALHQVVGVLLQHDVSVQPGKEEAVQIDRPSLLQRVELGYRVVEESAIPLALPKQIALGGPRIELDQFGQYEGALVALTLEDGSSVFKRVGAALPPPLSHLRQFESIGGLGNSQILAIGKGQSKVPLISHARLIVGVLYHQ
jgi:hypothetical protein